MLLKTNFNSVDTCFSVNCLIVSLASILEITNAISRFVLVCVVLFFLLGLVINLEWLLGRVKVQKNQQRKWYSRMKKSPGQPTEILKGPVGWQ